MWRHRDPVVPDPRRATYPDVVPLSERERAFTDDGRRWKSGGEAYGTSFLPASAASAGRPGEARQRIPFDATTFERGPHVTAQATGGLIMSGASLTTWLLLRYAEAANRVWDAGLDLHYIRLGVVGTMLQAGDHTLHEILQASAVLPRDAVYRALDLLSRDAMYRALAELQDFAYDHDNWERYRHLPPLTERELREHVTPEGLFPDELVRGPGVAAYDPVDDARQALTDQLGGQRGSGADRDFTVTVVDGGHEVVHQPTGLLTRFRGERHEVVYHEAVPGFGSRALRGLKVAIEQLRQEDGRLAPRYRLLGEPAVADRFEIREAPRDLRRGRKAAFSVLEKDTGRLLHYVADGRVIAKDQPVEAGLGYLRSDMFHPGGEPALLDAVGRPSARYRVEGLGGERVALVPAGSGAAGERLVVGAGNGRLLEEIVAAPDRHGELPGSYWKFDYQAGIALRVGEDGRTVAFLGGRFGHAQLESTDGGGVRVLLPGQEGVAPRVLFERPGFERPGFEPGAQQPQSVRREPGYARKTPVTDDEISDPLASPRDATAALPAPGHAAGARQSGVQPDFSLGRFAERFGKLEEEAAGRLWDEASRITAEHNPFDPSIGEPGESLLRRDPEQYWATMRVAQVLHENEDAPDRLKQAVEVARKLRERRGAGARGGGLLGGAPAGGDGPAGGLLLRDASGEPLRDAGGEPLGLRLGAEWDAGQVPRWVLRGEGGVLLGAVTVVEAGPSQYGVLYPGWGPQPVVFAADGTYQGILGGPGAGQGYPVAGGQDTTGPGTSGAAIADPGTSGAGTSRAAMADPGTSGAGTSRAAMADPETSGAGTSRAAIADPGTSGAGMPRAAMADPGTSGAGMADPETSGAAMAGAAAGRVPGQRVPGQWAPEAERPVAGVEEPAGFPLRSGKAPSTGAAAAPPVAHLLDAAGQAVPGRTVTPEDLLTGERGVAVTGGPQGTLHLTEDGQFRYRSVALPGTGRSLLFETPAGWDGLIGVDDAVVHTDPAGRELFVNLPVPDTEDAFAAWRFESAAYPSQRLTPLTGDPLGPLAGDPLGPLRGLHVHTDYTADGTGGLRAVHHLTVLPGNPATAVAGPLPPSLTGPLPDGFTLTDPPTGHVWHFDAWGRLRYHDLPVPGGVVLRAAARAPGLPFQYLIPATLLPVWPHRPHAEYRWPAPQGLQVRAIAHAGDTSVPAVWALDLLAPQGQPTSGHALLFDGVQLYLLDITGHAPTQPLSLPFPGIPPASDSDSVTGAPPASESTDSFGMDLDFPELDPGWLDLPGPDRPGEPAMPGVGGSGAEAAGPDSRGSEAEAAGPDSRGLPDGGSGDRVPGPPGESTADGVPGPSQPDRPAPPPVAGSSDADRAAMKILEGFLESHGPAELARRLWIGEKRLRHMRAGYGVGGWLSRLRRLEEIARVEADWRLVPVAHGGFAVAVRRGQDIAHFDLQGAVSHWALALPGSGHRLELNGPEGTARLVDAYGTTKIPATISPGDGGRLHVRQADGEWWVDGAERVVRGYRRASGAPDPARRLSDWADKPGELALNDWQDTLRTIMTKHGLSEQKDMARLLGVAEARFSREEKRKEQSAFGSPAAGACRGLPDLREHRELEHRNHQGAGFFLQGRFRCGHHAPLPGGKGRGLEGQPSGCRPVGALRPGGYAAAGDTGRQATATWLGTLGTAAREGRRCHGQPGCGGRGTPVAPVRPADPGLLRPPADANPSPFRRLTAAGALLPAPRREPEPMDATTTATTPDTDLPVGPSAAPQMPGTAAESEAGPSYLHTINWSDTSPP